MAVEVKICGLRRPADVTVAVRAGATYLGVVYAGGPRRVTDVEAREVVAAAEGRPVLAVWGPPDRDAVLRSRDSAGFSGVQLHGGSDPALAEGLRREGLLVWRVLRVAGEEDLLHLDHLQEGADGVLVEPRVFGKDGGAGVALDLALARAARGRFDAEIARSTKHEAPSSRFILAGGLRPDTVRAAIRAARPDIVDVSSGVERAPGLKDPFLIRRFLDESIAALSPP